MTLFRSKAQSLLFYLVDFTRKKINKKLFARFPQNAAKFS